MRARVAAASAQPRAVALTNRAYRVELLADHSLSVSSSGAAQTFRPEFLVLYCSRRPRIATVRGPEVCHLCVPQWKTSDGAATVDYFRAASSTWKTSASAATCREDRILWSFPPQAAFDLTAEVTLPEGAGEPRVTVTLIPLQAGCFSVGYSGAPKCAPDRLQALWQPPVWQEKRFPSAPVLSMEHMCSLTAALLTVDGTTFGVLADPDFLPFRLPTLFNARCGVLLRNESGEAQPMFFAPVLGEADSELAANSHYTASFRILVRKGDIYEAERHAATDLYHVRDMRENHLCSLNTTIENMIEFALDNNLAQWNADLRGCDYSTDVPGTVKVVSALHPMSLAMITDRREIFDRRALPITEYLAVPREVSLHHGPQTEGPGSFRPNAGADGGSVRMVLALPLFRRPVSGAAAERFLAIHRAAGLEPKCT